MHKSSSQKSSGLFLSPEPPSTKWTHTTMDFIVPLPMSSKGNIEIFTVVDRLSNITPFILLWSNLDALEAALLIKNLVHRNQGFPSSIVSDRSPIVKKNFWKSFCSNLGTKLSPSSACHTQFDGQSDVMNCKVGEKVLSSVHFGRSNWDKYLVDFEVAYNSSFNATSVFPPFCLCSGIDSVTVPTSLVSSPYPAASKCLRSIQKANGEAQKTIKVVISQPLGSLTKSTYQVSTKLET